MRRVREHRAVVKHNTISCFARIGLSSFAPPQPSSEPSQPCRISHFSFPEAIPVRVPDEPSTETITLRIIFSSTQEMGYGETPPNPLYGSFAAVNE
jgi:hypothetical protein